MAQYLLATGLIFALLTGGVLVHRFYRGFARRHPELGPFRGEAGCGGCMADGGCGSAACTPPRGDGDPSSPPDGRRLDSVPESDMLA